MANDPIELITQGSTAWLDVRQEFVEAQAGRCAICRDPLADAQLDHCHSSGFIRGVLCISCNTKLGWYETKRREIETYLAQASEFTAHRVNSRMSRSDRLRHYWQTKVLD